MQLIYLPRVYKDLKKIPKIEQRKIIRKLEALTQDPYLGKSLLGKYRDLLSLKAWPYRITYKIRGTSVLIYSIKHRQGAYKN